MIRDMVLEDPLVAQSYEQASELTWSGIWLGKPFLEVSWEVGDPGLAQKIGQRGIVCSIGEILRHHQASLGLEEVATTLGEREDREVYRRVFYERFQGLSDLTGKNIVTYTEQDDELKYLLCFEPGLTAETRFTRLQALSHDAVCVLSNDSNVAATWLYGSLSKGNIYARDVDLGIVVESKLPRGGEPYYRNSINCLVPRTICQNRFPTSSAVELATNYLDLVTAKKLEELTTASGIKLDGHIIPRTYFEDPVCCKSHQRFAEEIKKGTLLFSR